MKYGEARVIWIMGPTSSGKTTVARALAGRLRDLGLPVLHYDGDEVRDFFGPALGFAPEDRQRVVQTICHLANKARQAGIWVVVSALTAHPQARELVHASVERLLVASIRCPIEECCRRDPKGLYRKAKDGEIDTLIGFNSCYEPPTRFDIELDTLAEGPEELAGRVLAKLAAA